MKLLIKINFTDKNTGAAYKVGDEVTFDEARADELLADKRGLVALIEEAPEVEEAPKKRAGKSKR